MSESGEFDDIFTQFAKVEQDAQRAARRRRIALFAGGAGLISVAALAAALTLSLSFADDIAEPSAGGTHKPASTATADPSPEPSASSTTRPEGEPTPTPTPESVPTPTPAPMPDENAGGHAVTPGAATNPAATPENESSAQGGCTCEQAPAVAQPPVEQKTNETISADGSESDPATQQAGSCTAGQVTVPDGVKMPVHTPMPQDSAPSALTDVKMP